MIIAKSNISFLVSIFNALKDLPVNQFPPPPRPPERRKLHFRVRL